MEKAADVSIHVVDRTRGYMQVADALRREIRRMDIPAGARLESGAEVDWMALSDWLV